MSWSCSRCETINPDTTDICEVCDTKKSHSIKPIRKREEHPTVTAVSLTTASTTKSSNWAWILTFIFGMASFILFMVYSSQSQELQSVRAQLNSQTDINSAIANAESNIRHSILGLNYYRVTLSDFYNAKTYPINNINGEQIGELYITYGWAYMENDVPINSKSLTTVRIIFNIYSENTNGYYGFTTYLDDRYDVEERHVPTIGNKYTAETSNYEMAIRVIEFKGNQDDYGFSELVADIVISNK